MPKQSIVGDPISIKSLLIAISNLPSDRPVYCPRRRLLFTQKEHWIGWLFEYNGPGAYGRQTRVKHDAKFAYNHIVCPEMLLYLAKAADVDRKLLAAANRAFSKGKTLMQKSRAIRAVIQWETVAAVLWPGAAHP